MTYELAYSADDVFAADMRYVNAASGVPLSDLVDRARAYWRGEGEPNELLVPGRLEVIRVGR